MDRSPLSGADFDRRSVRHQGPYLGDFAVREGDAAIGPVAVHPVVEGQGVGLAVDEDIATGSPSARPRIGAILGVGVGDVEALVIARLRIGVIERVAALGRLFVTLETLVPPWRVAELEAAHG